MNQTLLEQVARLKVRLRQDVGLSLNTRRFFEEADYGQEILERADDSDDIEVVKLAPPPPPLQARPTPPAPSPHAQNRGVTSTARAPEVHRRGRPGRPTSTNTPASPARRQDREVIIRRMFNCPAKA